MRILSNDICKYLQNTAKYLQITRMRWQLHALRIGVGAAGYAVGHGARRSKAGLTEVVVGEVSIEQSLLAPGGVAPYVPGHGGQHY